MQYHKVDTNGKYWIQEADTLPTWISAYKGRILYTKDKNTFYIGGLSEWISFANIQKVSVSGQGNIIINSPYDILTLEAGLGVSITTNPTGKTVTLTLANNFGRIHVAGEPSTSDAIATWINDNFLMYGNNGITVSGFSSLRKIWFSQTPNYGAVSVAGQPTISAITTNDTLTFVPGTGITITTNPSTRTLTFGIDTFFADAKVYIFNDTAPIGWRIVSGTGDALIGIGGTPATMTWSINSHSHLGGSHSMNIPTNHVHTGSDHIHNVPAFPLTIDHVPNHYHTLVDYYELQTASPPIVLPVARHDYDCSVNTLSRMTISTVNTGGTVSAQGLGHSHGNTTATTPFTSSSAGAGAGISNSGPWVNSSPGNTWRPYAAVGIIVERT